MYSSILFDSSAFSSAQDRRCNDIYTPRSKHMDSVETGTNAVSSISMEFKDGVYEIYRLMTCVSRHKYRAEALAQFEIEKKLLNKIKSLKGFVQ